MTFKNNYLLLQALLIVVVGAGMLFISPLVAHADSSESVNGAQQKIFDDQICAPIKNPDPCADYNSQQALDNAEQEICGKYQSQVAAGCQAYSQAAVSEAYKSPTNDVCGGPSDDPVSLSINIGCEGKGNPIADATFAIIRVLSDGVGLVVVASIIVGGIQYTSSQGDPQATAKAVGRIRSSVLALVIFIFAYAILNYVIPAGVL